MIDHAAVQAHFLALRTLTGGGRARGLSAITDAGLRDEVASLLACDVSDAEFMRPRAAGLVPFADADRPPPPIEGAVLGERFEVLAVTAEGGFGWVFRGRDERTGAPVAVKLFKPAPDSAVAADIEAAVAREAQVLAQLADETPHIVAYEGAGTWIAPDGGRHAYLVMEWVDGPTLAELAAGRRPPWSFPQAVALLTPVAEALARAHALGVAHRDVKPDNILCAGDPDRPDLKLIDFGAAKRAAERARGFASTGGQVGMVSYLYAAPEQLQRGKRASGPWSDVYALSLTLVAVSLGRHPWAELSFVEVMARALDPRQRPTPGSVGLEVSARVEAVMKRALAVNARRRPRDARAL